MTRKQAEEARKRCEAATPGPWSLWLKEPDPNRVFAAHARIDLPAALDMLGRAAEIIHTYKNRLPRDAWEWFQEWNGDGAPSTEEPNAG